MSLLLTPQTEPLDARAAYQDAEVEAVGAYRAWCAAAPDERRTAYAVFVAAADRAAAALDGLRRHEEAPGGAGPDGP